MNKILKPKKEVIIAIIFISCLAAFYWGFNYLKGIDIFKRQRVFYAEYNNVLGLLEANPVIINGFKVGQVTNISLKKDDVRKIIVEFIVHEKFEIPINTIARIESTDLLGSKAIVLYLGDSPVMAQSGDFLIGDIEKTLKEEVNIQMLPLKYKVEDLLSSFDSALAIVQYIFNENTRENLQKSFESIRYTIANIEKTSSRIDTLLITQQSRLVNILANIESITLNIRNQNAHIANLLQNASRLSDTLLVSQLRSTIINLNNTIANLDEITAKIKQGDGTLGMLIHTDSLHRQLNLLSKDMHLLLEDLRLNPHRYIHFSVFGRNPSKNRYQQP